MAVDCAVIDDDLTQLLLNNKSKDILRSTLLEHYFPDSMIYYHHNYLFYEQDATVLQGNYEEQTKNR